MDNVYLLQIWQKLPQILSLYDQDETSPAFGVGDRRFWAWKTIDFGNGTFQAASYGISLLLSHNLLPAYITRASALNYIDSMFYGLDFLIDKNGSLSEAFPYESSFCVTALVALNCLQSIENMQNILDDGKRKYYLALISRMMRYIKSSDEYHAVISNHLATASLALYKWYQLTQDEDSLKKSHYFLEKIFKYQSDEGWFLEYEGADPGYQTWCIDHLAELFVINQDEKLKKSLEKAIKFLVYFVHPDGSFGGNYGSRNTRFYFPSGIEYLASYFPEAYAMAAVMRFNIKEFNTVSLVSMDDLNLIPLFNSYCHAAVIFEQAKNNKLEQERLPFQNSEPFLKQFKNAGLIINNGVNHYTVISTHKGGVCYHFKKNKLSSLINGGVVLGSKNGKKWSTQAYAKENQINVLEQSGEIIIKSLFSRMNKSFPNPYLFILLRIMNISIMRISFLNIWIKKILVWYLITRRKYLLISNTRHIILGENLKIEDSWQDTEQFKQLDLMSSFYAIHMASQGYWQKNDTTL